MSSEESNIEVSASAVSEPTPELSPEPQKEKRGKRKASSVPPPPVQEEEEQPEKKKRGRKPGQVKKQGTPKKSKSKKGSAEGVTKRRKVRKYDSYATYIHRVLKQVHPEIGIGKKTMRIFDSLVSDLFKRCCEDAGELVTYAKKTTMQTRDMASAVKLVIPGELSKHAQSEADKAIALYDASK